MRACLNVGTDPDVARADLSRLALDGRTRTGDPVWRTGEGLAATEFEQAFGVRLGRVSKENWPTKNPPDFVIQGGALNGKTVDFLYTKDSAYAVAKSNDHFLVSAKAERAALNNIIKHVEKADFVPMDFRTLSTANEQRLLQNVILRLSPEQKAKLLIIR